VTSGDGRSEQKGPHQRIVTGLDGWFVHEMNRVGDDHVWIAQPIDNHGLLNRKEFGGCIAFSSPLLLPGFSGRA
jgi:hypothetical protein